MHPSTPFPRRATSTLILALFLGGCTNKPAQPLAVNPMHDPLTTAQTKTGRAIAGRPTYLPPIELTGTTTSMIPFTISDRKPEGVSIDTFRSVGGVPSVSVPANNNSRRLSDDLDLAGGFSPYLHNIRWHNLAFRDVTSGDEWTLLQSRAIISKFQAFSNPQTTIDNAPAAILCFVVTTEDFDKDGALTDQDASLLMIASGNGRNPRVISPDHAQVWSVTFTPQSLHLSFMVRSDTNANGRFDDEDISIPYVLPITNPGPAKPFISPTTRESMERLLR